MFLLSVWAMEIFPLFRDIAVKVSSGIGGDNLFTGFSFGNNGDIKRKIFAAKKLSNFKSLIF